MTAQERWARFLDQIEGRHRQIRQEARVAARAAAATLSGIDASPISQAWSATHTRLIELESRIESTWHDQMDQSLDDEGATAEIRAVAIEEGEAVRYRMEDAREEVEPIILAEVARQLFARACASPARGACVRCQAPLEPQLCFRAVELRCRCCGVMTLFEPGELLRGFAAVGAHALPQEAARVEWLEVRNAERRVRRARPPCPVALLKDYERAQIAYWRRYLAVRAEIEPELGRDLAREVRARMEAWYRSYAEYEEEWVRAGRPREAIT